MYRIIRRPKPRVQDFRSDAEKGKTPRQGQVDDPRRYTGISTFAPIAHAAERARRYSLGNYLAEMHVPIELLDQTGLDSGHLTVQGSEQGRFAMVSSVHAVDSVLKAD